ncbi:MAG: phenylalanine--tRNA ligase subunit beta [Armatimonadetes bacterium]|nr:phenylalanine--tRNA ligase subunit beta [Armatimonadota bacterium]
MKFPYSMLLDYVETGLTAHQIGDLLTMAGFELEGIEEFGDEWVLDVKVMSNRGDGLSVFGLAREVLAKDQQSSATKLYQRAAARFQDIGVPATIFIEDETARIESESCRRFAVRGFSGVNAKDQSPAWMQKRLDASGMRPISLLVDLTNYIMLELGQPLHAFDRDKLAEGRIVVRHAGPGEKLTTLNGLEHELDGQMMICDAAKPVGVPGVMGGLETEVTDETTNLLLESANFVNTVVRKTRKQLGLATEASYRFERSVDPDGVVAATLRFTELLLDSQPGIQVSNIVDLYPGQQTFAPVRLRIEKACILLGMDVTFEQATTYLRRLGMDVSQSGGDLMVVPPSWRPDIVREEDLVEELGRVHGYELIPEAYPAGSTPLGGSKGRYLMMDRVREMMLRSGYSQIISHSLRDYSPLDDGKLERVAPRNPASPEHCVLRNSLLPSLADAARRNGARDLHLFEIGKVFFKSGSYNESLCWSILSQGSLIPENRKGDKPPHADFFALKAAIEGVFEYLGVSHLVQYREPNLVDGRFHPTRCASVDFGEEDEYVGRFGQIHPEVAKATGLEPDTLIAELDLGWILNLSEPKLDIKSISRHPAVRRDIAVLISKSVPYSQVERAIRNAGGDVLEKQWLFDVFEGANIPDGKHSLGIGLQFRKHGNFTDEEANQVRDRIVAELESLGATLR